MVKKKKSSGIFELEQEHWVRTDHIEKQYIKNTIRKNENAF